MPMMSIPRSPVQYATSIIARFLFPMVLADYILDWRPKCDIPEVFVTVKAPYSVSKTVKGIWQKDSRVRPQCGQFTVNLRKIVRFYSDYILWFTAKMQD